MALTPGEGDGGTGGVLGGTANSICAISPSDLVGTLGNLITRIETLEFQLSQIVGANLHTEQLSNISEQVGWVYGVEYMGIPGWTQTEYGTLIPPPGFTLTGSGIQLFNSCTGEFEDYQAVVMDENGVLQWGATTAGNLCGAKVEDWNDAAAAVGPQDYASAKYSGGWSSESRGMTVQNTNNSITSSGGSANAEIVVATAGLYHVTGHARFLSAGAFGTAYADTISLTVSNIDDAAQTMGGTDGRSIEGIFASLYPSVNAAANWLLDAGDTLRAYAEPGGSSGITSRNLTSMSITAVRISS